MTVKVTQSEENLIRLVSLFGAEQATHVTVNDCGDCTLPCRELLFLKRGEGDSYNIVNSVTVKADHFPNLVDIPVCEISDLEVPYEWKSVE